MPSSSPPQIDWLEITGRAVPSSSPPQIDWPEITGRAVKRLRAPKVKPVPPSIIRQAQRSWDGVQDPEDPPGVLRHNLHHEFTEAEAKAVGADSPETAAAIFAKKMKDAGAHTQPPTSVTVVIDPDNTGNLRLVGWKAGARRGRATASA